MDLSLKQFLSLYEFDDTTGEVSKLQAAIALIDTQIQQRTGPLMQQKARLQKLLAVKQQQAQRDTKSNADNSAQQNGNPMQAQQQGNGGPQQPGSQGG